MRRTSKLWLNPTVVRAAFEQQGFRGAVEEYRFAPPRRWRFDYAWPDVLVALEVEGGAFTGGRHTRGAGFEKDMEKYNEAAALGWTVLRVLPRNLLTAETFDLLKRVFETKRAA